jgi:hypothetical protein
MRTAVLAAALAFTPFAGGETTIGPGRRLANWVLTALDRRRKRIDG